MYHIASMDRIDNNMDIGTNLQYWMKKRDLKDADLAEKLQEMGIKISKESISKYRRSERTPNPQTISAIAKALNIAEQDLFDPTKKEQIVKSELQKNYRKYIHEIPEIQTMENMLRFRYAVVGAGAEALADISVLDGIYIPKELLPEDFERHFHPDDIIVTRVIGNSMEPKFRENDIIFFEMFRGKEYTPFMDGIYLVRYGDSIQIKNVQFLGNGDIRIISFNQAYPPVQPVKDLGVDWEILGKPIIHWSVEMFGWIEKTHKRG